jgi:hypothetical protein
VGIYLLIIQQNITGEHTLILTTMKNSNLLQSVFALPDDGGSTMLPNNSGALPPTYMVSHP